MSIFNKLFRFSNKKIYENITSTKENLMRLEILTNELNKKEEENKSHEAFVSMAMESLNDPAWGKDINGKFVFINDAGIRKILKTTPEKRLNKSMPPLMTFCVNGMMRIKNKLLFKN